MLISYFSDYTIKEYGISYEGLMTGIEISKHQHQSVFEILSHKVLYLVTTPKKSKYKTVVPVFLVHTKKGKLILWGGTHFIIKITDPFTDLKLYSNENEATAEELKSYSEINDIIVKKGKATELWSIILQKFEEVDGEWKVTHCSVTSFPNQEIARAKFHEWLYMDECNEKCGYGKVVRKENFYEYWFNRPNVKDFTKLVQSNLYNQNN